MNKLVYTMSFLALIFGCNDPKTEKDKKDEGWNSIYEQYVEPVSFYTEDSIRIFGDLVIKDDRAPLILLCHQAGSNARGEYQNILPKLVGHGFNVLAIDLRSGGQLYSSYNRTISGLDKTYEYCDAYTDMEAALGFINANKFTGKIIVWGSSFSATLAIQFGARNKEHIAGVIAFSPASGVPLADCLPDPYIKQYDQPLLVLRPKRELEIKSVKRQFQLIDSSGHKTYIAEYGIHGSSMLDDNRVEGNIEKNWMIVLEFITGI